jgi:hypothetical protein
VPRARVKKRVRAPRNKKTGKGAATGVGVRDESRPTLHLHSFRPEAGKGSRLLAKDTDQGPSDGRHVYNNVKEC